MHGDILKVLISEEEIARRVREMGAQLSVDYRGKDVVVICVLKGACVFFTDLVRNMDCQLEMEFMAISSYGGGTKTSGVVRISKDIDTSITNRHVLIVEDIMDSGLTLSHLKKLLESRSPASIRVACLLDKPERRECDITPDYCGFTIPNEFVVGYGLDLAGFYRNLEYVGILKPSVYSE
ncbi:MAG: hypoxanthine phosphoribosyltransferase [Clostridia bacterium]|nr:hypoxanthine phosphoribosyltransferase [Clostridia bacterium]